MAELGMFCFNFNQIIEEGLFRTPLDSAGKWINYGSNNLAPQIFIDLYNLSSTHGGIVNRKKDYIAGKDIDYTNNTSEFKLWAEFANNGQGLHKLIKQLALDLSLYGGYCIQVIWNMDRTINDIIYQDFSQVRRGFNKDTEKKNKTYNNLYDQGYWISANWKDKYKFKPEFFNMFSYKTAILPTTNQEQIENPVPREPVFLYYYRQAPGIQWYPLPDYYSGAKAIQSEIDLLDFIYNNINQSFNPSGILKVPATLTPEDQQLFKERIKSELAGTKNTGKVFVVFADGDKAVEWSPTNNAPSDKGIEPYNDIIVQKIISAHQLPSPTIIGLPGGASLSGDGNTIAIANAEFYNQSILPAREEILYHINKLVKLAGFPTDSVSIIENIPIKSTETKPENVSFMEHIATKSINNNG